MRAFPAVVAALLSSLAAQQAMATCYVIYGANEQVLYRSMEPPVDLSQPLHQTLPKLAPGGKLVFTLDNHGCDAEVNRLAPKLAMPEAPRIPRALDSAKG